MTTPHPAAMSAAKDIEELNALLVGWQPWLTDKIHRHFAPVLEEKDRRIAELKEQCDDADILLGNGWQNVLEFAKGAPGPVAALNAHICSLNARITELEAQQARDRATIAELTLGDSDKEKLVQNMLKLERERNELKAQCAAKDTALKETTGWTHRAMELEISSSMQAAQSAAIELSREAMLPTAGQGWLSPQEAAWMRDQLKAKDEALEVGVRAYAALEASITDRELQAQIQALEFALTNSHDWVRTKLAALKAGGSLL